MPYWPPPRFASWNRDESNRLILLKVPEQVRLEPLNEKPPNPPSLSTLDNTTVPPRTAPTLPSLPPEIHYTILSYLAPVDRVCLALTSRRLCASVLASPRLTAETWSRFTNITEFSNRYWNPNTIYLTSAPEQYQLCQRLAHGWVNKRAWRYCWMCHKILPRDEEFWLKNRDGNGAKRVQGRKTPRWSAKTGVDKEVWLSWSRNRKLKWIVDVWCKAGWEDSSVVGCEWCREKLFADDAERMRVELTESKAMSIEGGTDKDVMDFVGTRHPVECPTCLERELTYTGRPPKRTRMKKHLRSTCGCLRDWTIGLAWCLGSAVVGLVMLIWRFAKWSARTLARHSRGCLPSSCRT